MSLRVALPARLAYVPSMRETLTLFRPVGAQELALIAAAEFRAFPPRLPFQPIFYPVLTEAYAIEIARDWNTRDEASGYAGFVTRFQVDAAFAARYPVRMAGARQHLELWVPAEELDELNRHIIGRIEVIAEFPCEHAPVRQAQPSDRDEMISVRLASAADIPALDVLIATSVRTLSVGFYTPEQIESGLRFVFGVDSQLIADQTYYVIDGLTGPVACGGWSHRATLYGADQHKTGPDLILDPATLPARIRAFFVHPDWARRGLATRLLATCAGAAAAAGFHSLELAATLPGEPLYAALGFVAHERSSVILPDGVALPIVRMTRPLASISSQHRG